MTMTTTTRLTGTPSCNESWRSSPIHTRVKRMIPPYTAAMA